jgi:DNA-binding NarL/FixJ family response regulator
MPPEDATAIVADDHELFRLALAELLGQQHGFARVHAVPSFDEALECLGREQDARLALFDLVMPGLNDAASLEAVRRAFPTVKVVVVSGSERREDILAALAAGVHGYIPKTMRLPAISAALSAVLDGGLFVPPALATLPPEATVEWPASLLAPRPAALAGLTARQRDVLPLLREGRSNKEIARALGLGSGTVKVHVAAILRALGVASRAGVAAATPDAVATSGVRPPPR